MLGLMDRAPHMIFINAGGHVIYANARCEEVMGYTRAALCSPEFRVETLIAPESSAVFREALARQQAGHDVPPFDCTLVTEDGRKLRTLISTKVMKMGNRVAIMGIVTDLTDRIRLENAVRAERDRAQAYLDIANVILVALDASGRVELINRKGAELLGWSAAELTGKDWFATCLPANAQHSVRQTFEQLVQGGAGPSTRHRNAVRTRDGRDRTIEWVNTLLRNEHGAVSGTLSSGTDVTDERETMGSLAQSEEKYRELFESAPIGIFRSTPDGRVLMVNPALVKMLGYSSAAELISINLEQRGYAQDFPRRRFMEAVERHGSVRGFEAKWARKDGSALLVRENAKAVRDSKGKTLYYEGTVEDITEYRLTQQALDWQFSFERLITEISVRFVNMAASDVDTGIESALCDLGLFLDVDRGYVFLFSDGNRKMSNTHEWCRDGITPHRPRLQDLDADVYHWSNSRLLREEVVAIPRVRDLPPEAAAEKKEFEIEQIRSVVTVPLVCGGRVLGFLGLDAVRAEKPWTDTTVSMLKIVGEIFASAMELKNQSLSLGKERLLFRTLMDNVPDHIYFKDAQSRFLNANRAMFEGHGCRSAEEIVGKTDFDLFAEEHARHAYRDEQDILRSGVPIIGKEEKEIWPDGHVTWASSTKLPFTDESGRIAGTFGISRDITRHKETEEQQTKLEAQMQHTQKLESLGILSGGIAHDFNNLLMGILGNTGLALMQLSPESPVWDHLKQIETTALRAAELTNQMLAYSGKSKCVIKPLHLSTLVREMAHLLEVSISKRIDLDYSFAEDLPPVEGDAAQIRQITMNLITNASDAIGNQKGRIVVKTGVVDLTRAYLNGCYIGEHLEPGRFAFLEVSDTGCGMDRKTLEKIFDPFFTTKIKGRGLGLAAVLGIVRAHKGTLKVYSEVGKGTNFKVFLPCATGASLPAPPAPDEASTWKGSGAILVVDDDEVIRMVTEQILAKLGFAVTLAPDGADALRHCEQAPQRFRAVLLDVTLPGISGRELVDRIRSQVGKAPIVLMSGYNEQIATLDLKPGSFNGFLQKPFTADALARELQSALGEP